MIESTLYMEQRMDRKSGMKNKLTAILLSGVLALGTAGSVFSAPAYAETVADKEETVFAIKDADGKTEKVLVNEVLRCAKDQNEIKDVSYLSDIENTSGTETFDKDGAKIVWKAAGKDIKYQGTCDRILPVELDVTYFLDGNKVRT